MALRMMSQSWPQLLMGSLCCGVMCGRGVEEDRVRCDV